MSSEAAGCVLVTGGTGGIGRATVERLLAEGRTVAFTYRSNADGARELEILGAGRARAFAFELRDRARPRQLEAEVEAALGSIEGLVNNAGIQHSRVVGLTSDDAWDEVLDVNLGGAFRVCRAVVPGMLRRRRGAIVNVASLGALHGVAGQGAYAASKAGLLALSRCLAREVGSRNVRVNAVVPGYVATEMTSGLSPAAVAALREGEALPGGTSAEAVAAAIAFLLSPGAIAVTGQSLVVDAGAAC
ncbi:MAG TPA: SDR family oxidoreductase [Thermoanaerobaculia bacterium]|nr:SDR family oxidoreductase [Thermoanaerobaculia bacterium]